MLVLRTIISVGLLLLLRLSTDIVGKLLHLEIVAIYAVFEAKTFSAL